ncbi:MAG: HAD family phosphatase [Gammaproteobacteria bacterium]|nr:HAD family phosphatase [Gammaproteobacteria bacterium]
MKSRNIQAVLFDFGGVIAEEGFRNGLIKIAEEQNLALSDITKQGMQAVYDSGFVLGNGNASEFWALLKHRTGIKGSDDILTQRILDGFIVRHWMVELVKRLHDNAYLTGILSDQTNWLDLLDAKYQFYDCFDYIYNSFYKGKGKRDSSTFNDVAQELGIPESSILFVDDDLGNVTRARKSGFQVIHYIDKTQFLNELNETLDLQI